MVAWWVPAALAVLVFAGGGAWALSQQCWGFDHCGGPSWPWSIGPEATLAREDMPDGRVGIRLGWRSAHEGIATYEHVRILVGDRELPCAQGDPGEGSWAPSRDGRWLDGDEVTRSNDIVVLGTRAPLDGHEIAVVLDPCNCLVAPRMTL